MKISELIQEAVHDPEIDWNKFKLAFAALATEDQESYGKIDGIIFLGLAGDPNSRSVLDVKLKGPARIGVADPEDSRELGFVDPKSKDNVRTAGEYYSNAYTLPDDPSNKGYQIRKEYEYNIIINHDYFDQATGEISTSLLAHEAQHRGFDIISQLPEIRNAVNPRTRKYLDELKTYGQDIAGLGLENTGERAFLEHLLIYSYQVPGQIGPGPDPTHMFRSKEEVKMFRTMYQDINSAAVAYIKRHPVPKGGLELLRKEVDRLTPDNVTINIFPDANGKPIITGFLDTLKQGAAVVADKLKQGANAVKSAFKGNKDKDSTAGSVGPKLDIVKDLQDLILAKDPDALPEFGADGKMGPETRAAMKKLGIVEITELQRIIDLARY